MSILMAQPGTFENDIKDALSKKPFYWINVQTSNAFVSGNHTQVRGIKAGLNYNNKLKFGVGYNWMKKSIDIEVDSIDHQVTMNYVSLNVDYSFYNKHPWTFTIPVQLGFGISSLENDKVKNNEGGIFLYEPNMMAEYHFLEYFSFSAGIGFRLFLINNKELDLNFTSPVYVLKFGVDFRKIWEENKIQIELQFIIRFVRTMEDFDLRNEASQSSDKEIEKVLRPKSFDDFTGQRSVLENLNIFVKAAKMRDESLDHVLLHGPPGLGKTTLAIIISNELDVNIKTTSGPVLDKPGDLAGLLTNLDENDVLFIDEIHRLSPVIEEYLYSAMEDYCIDLVIDSGPNARSVQIDLNPFTLIGATTRSGLLTAPLRARFGINSRLSYYDTKTLTDIVERSAGILDVPIDYEAAYEIAGRSRGTPRIANALLRRVRDFAQIEGDGQIDIHITKSSLKALQVDAHGLDEMDNKILSTLIDKFSGGPVGLSTIATAVGEQAETLEEVYEPFLIQEGFLVRTTRGRQATELAYKHLNRTGSNNQSALFD